MTKRRSEAMRASHSLRVQERPPLRVVCGTLRIEAGEVLAGMTDEGELCRVSFLDGRPAGDVLHDWQLEWPATQFSKGKLPLPLEALPMVEVGTELQRIVWLAIREIPAGEVRTYGDIADMVGMPGRARAVGRACRMSHLAYVVPCHRVVAAQGLGGFGAAGTVLKETLLRREGIVTEGGKPRRVRNAV